MGVAILGGLLLVFFSHVVWLLLAVYCFGCFVGC